ncbi:MAG: pyrimidine 5'-nucleotidase [Chloroflexi bacterium]|nr:pyrimidine 5'-nucleotidase [Chloroflexota bacterium]
MPFTTIFFDLDGTLYPNGIGLWEEISVRIDEYMHSRLGISEKLIPNLRQKYFLEYGTTLRGLQAKQHVDGQDYLEFVHNIPYEKYLNVDPPLREMLLQLNQKKWVFTNSSEKHARRVLKHLGIEDCFAGILDVVEMDFNNKPDRAVFKKALQISGENQAENCILLDDLPQNLAPARELGFFTVLVGSDEPNESANISIANPNELTKVMPELVE